MKVIEAEDPKPMKKGLYHAFYSNDEEKVAWDNLTFCFLDTDSGRVIIEKYLSTILFLFEQYKILYKERAKREDRYVWKESFWINCDYKRIITVDILPESDWLKFAMDLLESVSKVDSLDHYFEFFMDSQLDPPRLDPTFPNVPPEEFEENLSHSSSILTKFIETVKTQYHVA